MVKYGLSNLHYEYPALDTLKILFGGVSQIIGAYLSPDNIGPLVDKAIMHLQELSPLRHNGDHLLPSETWDIPRYSDVHNSDDPFGNLCRHIGGRSSAMWQCHYHWRQNGHYNGLLQFNNFVSRQGGHIDMQRAAVQVNLALDQLANDFLCNLMDTKHRFNLSIKLGWSVDRAILERLL